MRRQERVVSEAENILAGVDWQGESGQRLLDELSMRDSWPLKFLGDPGRDVLMRVVRAHDANYTLGVLVRDGVTRADALEVVANRAPAEQLEILAGLDLENPWFRQELSQEPRARELLVAHRILLTLATRWRSCKLGELETLARAELAGERLAMNFLAPIVIRLGTHAVAARCSGNELADELLEFAHSRTPLQAVQVANEVRLSCRPAPAFPGSRPGAPTLDPRTPARECERTTKCDYGGCAQPAFPCRAGC
jgi:hypothetical protein